MRVLYQYLPKISLQVAPGIRNHVNYRDVHFADKGMRDEFFACRGPRSRKNRENTARNLGDSWNEYTQAWK